MARYRVLQFMGPRHNAAQVSKKWVLVVGNLRHRVEPGPITSELYSTCPTGEHQGVLQRHSMQINFTAPLSTSHVPEDA